MASYPVIYFAYVRDLRDSLCGTESPRSRVNIVISVGLFGDPRMKMYR